MEYLRFWITSLNTKLEREIAIVISNTLSRLPEKTRQDVIKGVSFYLETRKRFTKLDTHIFQEDGKKPEIVINCIKMEKKSNSYRQKIISQMIALVVLNHLSGKRSKSATEKEVKDLCKKWGFGRTFQNKLYSK
jgi:hypothetical protein